MPEGKLKQVIQEALSNADAADYLEDQVDGMEHFFAAAKVQAIAAAVEDYQLTVNEMRHLKDPVKIQQYTNHLVTLALFIEEKLKELHAMQQNFTAADFRMAHRHGHIVSLSPQLRRGVTIALAILQKNDALES